MKRIVLYHPDHAAVGIETAENMGLADYCYATRSIPHDEIWITSDPAVISAYECVLEDQRDIIDMLRS